MQPEWLIIDGYNLLHQYDELAKIIRSDIATARHRLLRLVENTAHRLAPKTTVVFDGREAGSDASVTSPNLEVIFSPGNLSADTVIERLVTAFPTPEKILVVTSDHAEHTTVSSAGAQVMSSQEFLARCEQDGRRSVSRQTPPGKEPKLGDLFPDGI